MTVTDSSVKTSHSHVTVNRACNPAVNEHDVLFVNAPEDCQQRVCHCFQFCSTLEQCLMVAQCVKQMDVSSDSSEDHSGVLGLTAERVLRQMPSEQVLLRKSHYLHTAIIYTSVLN